MRSAVAVAVVAAAVLVGPGVLGRPALAAEREQVRIAAEGAHERAGHQGAAREGAGQEPEAEAGAEHGAGHHPRLDVKSLVLQLLNFGVLIFILVRFGGRAVSKALLARHQQIKTDLQAATEARAAADERLRRQEARLASLETEIAGLRAGIHQEAEAEKARLVAAAEERAQRIRQETSFMLDQQVKEAEALLKREVAEAALTIAEALLKSTLDGRDQQRLVDTFVGEVAHGNGHRKNGSDGADAAGALDGAIARPPAPRSEV